jgi:hypothetical protein
MADRRDGPRHRTFKGGAISFDIASGLECTVRNVSQGGACLDIPKIGGVPDQFELIIIPDGIRRSCQVSWRAKDRVGVRFA